MQVNALRQAGYCLSDAIFAQSFSVAIPTNSTEATTLAAALVKTKSDQEQDGLLAQHQSLLNASVLAALKEQANPYLQRGDYQKANSANR